MDSGRTQTFERGGAKYTQTFERHGTKYTEFCKKVIYVCIPAPSSICVRTLDLSRSGERLQFTIVFETYQGHVSALRSVCNSVFIYTFILEAIRCAWTSVSPLIRRQMFVRRFSFGRSVGRSDISSVCSFILNYRYILIKL